MELSGLRDGPGLSGESPTPALLLALWRALRAVDCAGDTIVGTLMGRCRKALGPGEKERERERWKPLTEHVSQTEEVTRESASVPLDKL